MRKVSRAASTLVEALVMAREEKVDFMASGVTYYTLLSLIPLVLLLFFAASFLGGEALAARILVAVTGMLPEAGEGAVRVVLQSNIGQGSIIGLLVLVAASMQLFRGFDIAFSEIYGDEHAETMVEEAQDALIALVVMATAVFLTVSAGAVLAAFPAFRSAGILWTALTFLGMTAVFLPLYYVFTDVDISLEGLVPGAVVAAAGWTLLQSGFSLYAGLLGGTVYGVFGGILLLVLWMYLGNILILFGAVVNYVNWKKG